MAMSSANYTIHFTNIGKLVKLYNLATTYQTAIRAWEEELAVIANDNDDEIDLLKAALIISRSYYTYLDSVKNRTATAAKNYIKEAVRKGILFTGGTYDLIEILESLYEDMTEADEDCDASAVVVGTGPTYDSDNTGTGSLSSPAGLTQLITDEAWCIICTSISGGAGAEVWEVQGEPDHHKVLSDSLTTGVAYTGADDNDQTLFTTTLTAYTAGTGYEIAGDADSELASWSFSGATKATNTDSAGDVYVDLDQLTAAEAGDNNNQLSNWTNITGAEYNQNTDSLGKWYVNIVDDTGGFFHVDIYKDSGKAGGDLVGHTATYNGAGAEAIVADNSSGLGGTITIDAVTAADTDITYVVGFDRVRAYKESGKTNLVCDGGLVGGGATTLNAQNSSGLTGSVTVSYSDGEADVQVRIGFAFAVDDKIYFTTTNDEAGTFAEFFREALGVAPRTIGDASETILDSLAE